MFFMRSITKSSKPCGFGRNEDTPTKRAGGSRRNTSLTLVRIVGCLPAFSRMMKGKPKWCGSLRLRRFILNDTRRSERKPIPMIQPGNRTLRDDLMCIWPVHCKENDGYSTSGKSKAASAQSANKGSPKSPDGIVIICYGGQKGELIGQKIGCCFTPLVTTKFTAKVYTWRSRVR